MEKIDITMTATLRPSIIEKTINSVNERIIRGQRDRYRMVINVDPVGEKVKQKAIVKIVQPFFDEIFFHYPKHPSFSRAVMTVWSNIKYDFVFHIEDDWQINEDIDVDNMISILKKYPKLSSLRLSKHDIPKKERFFMFSGHWVYIKEDEFYMGLNRKKQFGLNPILIKKSFIDEALPRMVDYLNPEKQFRDTNKNMADLIEKWDYGLYTKPGKKATVKDIGLSWRIQRNLKKPENSTFLTWV